MKKLFTAVILTLLSLMPITVLADSIPDGSHNVTNFFSIDNNNYDEYRFFLSVEAGHGGFGEITNMPTIVSGGSQNPTDGGEGYMYAIKKSDEDKIEGLHSDFGCVKPIYSDGNENDCVLWKDASINKKYIFKSTLLPLHLFEALPDSDETIQKVIVLHVDNISGGTVSAHIVNSQNRTEKNKVMYSFNSQYEAVIQAPSSRLEAQNVTTSLQNKAAPTVATKTPDAIKELNTSAQAQTKPTNNSSVLIAIIIVCLGIIGLLGAKLAWKK